AGIPGIAARIGAAAGPGAELLDDPRGEAGRRIGETVGEGLGLGTLDPLVAGLFLEEVRELREVALLFFALGRRLRVAAHGEEVEVDAGEALGVLPAEDGGDEGAPVAALRAEAPVAEDVGHQLGEEVGDLDDAEALLSRREGKRVAGKRWRDDGEVLGEKRDQLVELEDRARPAVREEERHRVRLLRRRVDEVQVDATQADLVLGEGIELLLPISPIETGLPVGDNVLEVREARAGGPRLERRLVGPARAGEALAKIGERGIRYQIGRAHV